MDAEAANATVQVVRIELARERVGYLSAGHPYPLLRRPDGTVTALSDAQHPMLGIAGATPADLIDDDITVVLLIADRGRG